MNQSLARAIEEQCKSEYMLFHMEIFNGNTLFGPSGKFPISPKFKEITIFGAHQDEEEYEGTELEDQILVELAETIHIGVESVFYPIVIPFSKAIRAKYHATRVFRW
ncbi:hypothetical protein WICPIJ_009566 [Wickerhamomyces pijperi]|uniref:Uncharacterized protein n=1 Tax=Wickerhamomyces pijperi TaxID=599730 RepID=A0A9P8PM31_WICPI|nr:hypothetical protein WICPIJ_009566 [Wickerhamomyces pijperi]